jgi:hypothetical protein
LFLDVEVTNHTMCDIRTVAKEESSVWRYFTFDDVTDKSSFKVENVESGKQCTYVQLSGENATKLKTHLMRFHMEEFQQVVSQGAEKKRPAMHYLVSELG